MRVNSTMRRAAAMFLAATIGILAPGVHPLVASAQDDPDAVPLEQGGNYATPPELPSGTGPPADTGKPDKTYKQEVDCVTRDLRNNIDLKNTPWAQEYLRLDDVHKLLSGSSGGLGSNRNGVPMKVAVIDTGVTAHPHFRQPVIGGGDYVDAAKGGTEDCDGHGTEVAGIIGANPKNADVGFMGMAPDAQIVSIRQSSENYKENTDPPPPPPAAPPATPAPEGDQPPAEQPPAEGGELPPEQQPNALRAPGARDDTAPAQQPPAGDGRSQEKEGTAGSVDTLAQAVVNAVNQDVQVVNVSINNCRTADGRISESEQKLQAAVRYAVEQDVVVVTAAGNTSEKCVQNDQPDPRKPKSVVTPPWFADDVLSVAAIDRSGNIADFSVNGPWVSVAAPGTDIISLDPAKGSDKLANQTVEGEGEPTPIQGTSFAAPYVAGLAALVRSQYPELSAREVMNRIKDTAQHPGAPGGRDNFVGHGVINPMAALTTTIPAEQGIPEAKSEVLPAELPPYDDGNRTAKIVAFAGAGGALAVLLVTLFVVHTIRRNRTDGDRMPRRSA